MAIPKQTRARIIAIAFMILAFAVGGLAAYWAVSFVNNGVNITAQEPFKIAQLGNYTLFVDHLHSARPAEFMIRPPAGSNAVPREPIWGSEELRLNGRLYAAVGHFHVTSPGAYQLVTPDNQGLNDLILCPRTTTGDILETLGAFILTMFFAVLSLLYWFRGIKSC